MPETADVDKALALLKRVILVQKNVYIRQLLRKHKVAAGDNKAQFEERLEAAIKDGTITLENLQSWLDETEGWGDEHVYLYDVPEKLAEDLPLQAKRRVARAELNDFWNAPPSIEFPEARTLTGIYLDETELRFVWHQGATVEVRAEDHDKPPAPEEDGEVYSYKAYRHDGSRNVTRVVIRPPERIAAVFIPGPVEPKTHGTERDQIAAEINRVFRLDECTLCSLEKAIPNIEKDMIGSKVSLPMQTRHTRLSDLQGIGYVDFVSRGKRSYLESTNLLEVRSAARDEGFTGASANFFFTFDGSTKPEAIRVNLFTDYDRVRMWARLSRDEVWTILNFIRKYVPSKKAS